MDFFPVLQADTWFSTNRRREVFHQPLPNVRSALLKNAPEIAFAVVEDSTVNYLQHDFSEVITEESVALSFARLRATLADLEWQSLPVDPALDLSLLVLEGDFHAAEALLLPERLQEAHSLLAAEELLVATPQRGQLIVMPYRADQPATTLAFASFCAELFANPVNEAISPIIWQVREGLLCDRLELNESVLSGIKSPAEQCVRPSLYSLGQVVFITMFGGIWAGLYAVALNFRELGLVLKYRLALSGATLSIPLVLAFYLKAPKTPIDRLFPLLAALGMALLTYIYQGELLKNAFKHGARRRGFIKQLVLIGASLLIALVLVAVIVHFDWL